MNLKNAVVLITGANRGLGLAFARVALARGARKVYAAARDPSTITLPGVEAIKLDVSNPAGVEAAAAHAKDVTLVINNAGIAAMGGFLDADAIESAQRHLDINVFGSLRVAQAFAPVLAANGGGALLNVLSIASWINGQPLGLYAMSKSAAWAMTNGLRHDLRAQGTQVLGLHMGFVDTDLTKGIDAPKSTPDSIVNQAFDGLEAGAEEVLADERTRQVKQGLSANPSVYL
ncbi:SDR family oxidoreductase [Achromobacter sp. MY14]|uniref:SDR family oxidoreductase n=1 Tax=unclassified Achromobacter TaxID=2626865 RepID=UPI001E4D7D4F|nr:SDR family oxidoreductase [Achromobacter sp. MY14]MCD0500019.1 SDR family oxidoreductase [Achromobacter sp. MY14]